MKVIRIKIKHLLLIGVFTILLLNLRNIQVFSYELIYEINPDFGSTLISNLSDHDIQSANLKLEYVLSKMDTPIYNLVGMGSGSTMMGQRVNPSDALDIKARYDQLNKGRSNDYTMNTSLILWYAGLSDDALSLIQQVDISQLSALESDKYHLILMNYYMSLCQLDQARLTLNELTQQYPKIQQTMEDYLNWIQKGIPLPDRTLSSNHLNPFTLEEKDILYLFRTISDQAFGNFYGTEVNSESSYKLSENRQISGYVYFDNQPVQGVIIALDDNPHISSSVHFSAAYAVTDEKGYYELPVFESRDSYAEIHIPWQLVHDKQALTDTEPYRMTVDEASYVQDYYFTNGAYLDMLTYGNGLFTYSIHDPAYSENRYYRIQVGYDSPDYYSYSGNSFDVQHNKSLQGEFTLEEAQGQLDIPYASVHSSSGYSLRDFIEPLYLTSDYYFRVMIYEDGRLISNGYFTKGLDYNLHIDLQDLSEGDKLIEEGRMEEAIAWFEANESKHGYGILTALYQYGYIIDPDAEYSIYIEGRDLDKAIYYGEKLLAINPNNPNYLSKCETLYAENHEYEKALDMASKRFELEPHREFIELNYYRRLILAGYYEEGVRGFLQLNDTSHRDWYDEYLILGHQVEDLNNDYQGWLATLDLNEIEPVFSLVRQGNYDDAYEYLSKLPDSELKTAYILIFQNAFSAYQTIDVIDFVDYYVETTNGLKDEALIHILKALVETGNWFF